MSRAFVKEGESENQWLHDVEPTLEALVKYLTKESGYKVYLKKSFYNEALGREINEMSNGLNYGINDEGHWDIYD